MKNELHTSKCNTELHNGASKSNIKLYNAISDFKKGGPYIPCLNYAKIQ